MSAPQLDLTESAVVARLRAAGCVFAEEEAELLMAAAQTPAELVSMMERRVVGLPLEHVVDWAEFRGLRIAVNPEVNRPGFDGDIENPEGIRSWWHPASTPTSCVSGRRGWRSTLARTPRCAPVR